MLKISDMFILLLKYVHTYIYGLSQSIGLDVLNGALSKGRCQVECLLKSNEIQYDGCQESEADQEVGSRTFGMIFRATCFKGYLR